MSKIMVAGLINIETTIKIGSFPIDYTPIDYKFWGIDSTVSGVAVNISKALKKLGDEPSVYSIIGNDLYKKSIEDTFVDEGIDTKDIKAVLDKTPQSAILYDDNGKRKIVLDLKDIQDTQYPDCDIQDALQNIDVAVICNINFSRKLLHEVKKAKKLIATDVHVVGDIDDSFNKEFMENADILFLSNENILGKEREFIKELSDTYHNKIIVIGMGDKGSIIYVREEDKISDIPAVYTRKVVNTIGAGDALFSAFIHFYNKTNDPYLSLENATIFASYKIGENGAANGFLTEKELMEIKSKLM